MHNILDEFEIQPDTTTIFELAALVRLKNPYRLKMGKNRVPAFYRLLLTRSL